jgi:hypothetical protein
MPAGQKTGMPRAIDPTDVQIGDRVCVLFDPNEASALRILVLAPTLQSQTRRLREGSIRNDSPERQGVRPIGSPREVIAVRRKSDPAQ